MRGTPVFGLFGATPNTTFGRLTSTARHVPFCQARSAVHTHVAEKQMTKAMANARH